jgi:SAM-dependent methyltransferase
VSPVDERHVPAGFTGALAGPRISYVTDPREWSFEMRKAAAVLTLDLSIAALADGFELKDASAFNILFDGCHPKFIDHGSLRDSYSGHWPGYSQFGDHFMNPLLIEAHAGVASTAAGMAVDGIPLALTVATTRGLNRLRGGSVAWVWRRALAERMSRRAGRETGEQLGAARLPREAIEKMLTKARRRIESLQSSTPSFWRDYEAEALPYDDGQATKKRSIVDRWSSDIDRRGSALDIGCNIGSFSQSLAAHFDRVIAIDNDPVAIDQLYRRGTIEPWGSKVTPAVVDIAQPTPAIGWLNRERASFLDRLGVVDLSVWLAVIHHLILTSGIPLTHVLQLVGRLSRFAIIEHIAPTDQSVATMTAGRRWATMPDFAEFRSHLDGQGFDLLQSEATAPTRMLVLVRCPG